MFGKERKNIKLSRQDYNELIWLYSGMVVMRDSFKDNIDLANDLNDTIIAQSNYDYSSSKVAEFEKFLDELSDRFYK